MTITHKILSQQLAKGRQSVNAERIYGLAKGKTKARVRVRIKSDSYDFQSYAKMDVYSPATMSWNEIGGVPYANMNTPHGLCHKLAREITEPSIETFEADFTSLVEQAKIILFD